MPLTRNRTQAEAASELHISVASLRRYIADGKLVPPKTEPWGLSQRNVYDDAWIARAKLTLENLRRRHVQ